MATSQQLRMFSTEPRRVSIHPETT